MMNVRQALLAAVTAVGLFAASTSAHAVIVLDDWNLNLSLAGTGGTDLVNIDHIVLTGQSTVTQTVVGGSALGQPFIESGFMQMAIYVEEGTNDIKVVDTGIAGAGLIFGYTGLTGTLNADGSITFNPGSGSINLFIDANNDKIFNAGDTELATFELIAPSGGSDLDFFGGTAANSTVDITLEQTGGIPGLFTDSADNPLSLTATLHLGNVDALLNPNFDPNPDNTGVIGGNGVSIIHLQHGGQYNVAIAEPTTLALLGASLFGLGIARRRRKTA